MTAPEFARCPKRTSTCPTPSYCQPTCTHAAWWLAGQMAPAMVGIDFATREAQTCDDATADQLEAEGWTIDRDALAGTHHGHYARHIAWRPIAEGGAA